jgi:hypothetical protein
MNIFDEEINFIHIPKNGGTTIRSICDSINIKYNGHDTNVFENYLQNNLIIIRNPIERFESAVYYALEYWSHEPHIKYLIDHKIDTPEKWIKIWMNPLHKYYFAVMEELKNKILKIGTKKPVYKWTYCPQYFWIKNPKYIIVMDNFDCELEYFIKNIINKDIKNIEINKQNSTLKKESSLSKTSIEFLKRVYKNDFLLYEFYKNIDISKRLPKQIKI